MRLIRIVWVMRESVDASAYPGAKTGQRVQITLACGHYVDVKASRHRTESKRKRNKRYRCEECTEYVVKLLDDATAREVVGKIENDKFCCNCGPGFTDPGRQANLQRGGVRPIPRRPFGDDRPELYARRHHLPDAKG